MYGFKRCTQVPSFQGVACCALVLDQPSQPKMYFPESLYDFELELMRGKCVSDLKYKRKATAFALWRLFWLEVIRVNAEVLVASNLLFLPNSMSSFASCLPAVTSGPKPDAWLQTHRGTAMLGPNPSVHFCRGSLCSPTSAAARLLRACFLYLHGQELALKITQLV